MPTLLEYAVLATAVYNDAKTPINAVSIPQGWSKLPLSYSDMQNSPMTSGFSANAYMNGDDIVISFKGTDFLIGTNDGQTRADGLADLALGFGLGSVQLIDAVRFYEQIRTNPEYLGKNITFTGHSLGAGLASIMSVWFDKKSTIFADAPFALTALNPVFIAAVSTFLSANNFNDPDFVSSNPVINLGQVLSREYQVTSYYVKGEVLNKLFSGLSTIVGSNHSILIGGGDQVGMVGLHSIVLHAALLISNQLRKDTLNLPNLLGSIFDTALYAYPLQSAQRDFLTKLLNEQIPQLTNKSQGLLPLFAQDMAKLGTPSTTGTANTFNKAVIAAAIEDYYFMNPASAKSFFNGVGNGVSFNLGDITGIAPANQLGRKKLIAATRQLDGGNDPLAQSIISTANAWYVQSARQPFYPLFSTTGMHATASGAGNTVMIGGGSENVLKGSDGNDAIFGGAGKDTLIGGAGNDYIQDGFGSNLLEGGVGNDKYKITTSIGQTGIDHILDSDGQGSIWLEDILNGDIQLKGSTNNATNTFTWTDINGLTYKFSPTLGGSLSANIGTLTIKGQVLGANQIVIDNFDLYKAQGKDGYLGIKLKGELAIVANNTSDQFLTGDYAKHDATITSTGKIQALTVYASEISNIAQTVTLTCSSGDASQIKCNIGSGILDFSSGSVTLTIPAGSNRVTVGLIYTGDPTQASGYQLTSTLTDTTNGVNTPLASNTLTVDFTAQPASTGSTAITGTADSVTIGAQQVAFTRYASGNAANAEVDAGNDLNLIGTSNGNSTINGGNGHGVIRTAGGNNQIYAGQKTDLATALAQAGTGTASGQQGYLIDTGSGNNTVVGGNGNDYVVSGGGNNLIVLGPGNATVQGGVSAYTLSSQSLQWTATTTNTGPASPIDPNAYVTVPTGFSLASTGTYTAVAGYHGNYSMDPSNPGGNGIAVGIGNDTIFGGTGNDVFWLSNGDNYLDAGGGNDHIFAGVGNNTIFGGVGNDTITGGGGNNYIDTETGSDVVFLQGGNNTVFGGGGNNIIYSGENGTNWATAFTGNNYIEVSSGNNVIYGSGGNDTIIGGSGNDTLRAGDGTEYIYGGTGIDDIWGGAGINVLNAGDGGTNTKATQVVAGSGNTTVYGGKGVDYIFGGSGKNVLYAGDGGTTTRATQVQAGSGDTTVYGGNGIDAIWGGAGKNILYAGDGGTANHATSVTAGTGDTTIYGGAGYNIISGGAGKNVIYAGDGGDATQATQVAAGAGDTTIYGGNGVDRIWAGSGNDLIYAGNGGTTSAPTYVTAGSGSDTIVAGAGYDVFFGGSGTTTYQINSGSGSVEIFNSGGGDTLAFGAGVSIADITAVDNGNAVTLTLNGGGSIAIANGGLSLASFADGTSATFAQLLSPTFTVGTTTYSSTDTTLASGLQNLTLTGSAGVTATANNLDNTITANQGDDLLIGGSGNDRLIAGIGNDTLMAGTGSTSMQGGGGNAVYVVNAGSGNVSINQTFNSDILQFGAGITAADLTASATAAPDGTSIVTLQIAGGNAVSVQGRATGLLDVVQFADGSSATLSQLLLQSNPAGATLSSSTGGILAGGIVDWNLTGSTDVSATGNDLDNVITANDGNDTLTGGTGNDTLVAGSGNDTLQGGSGNTTYVFNSGSGHATIVPGAGANLIQFGQGITVSSLSVGVTRAADGSPALLIDSGTGSLEVINALTSGYNTFAFADGSILSLDQLIAQAQTPAVNSTGDAAGLLIDGGFGNDLIVGGVGNDTIYSWGGNDTLTAGSGDTVIYGGNTGNDLIYAGSGNDTLVAGGGNDILYGGTGSTTYVVDLSASMTTIANGSNGDTLQFTAGIRASDLVTSVSISANGSIVTTITSNFGGSLQIQGGMLNQVQFDDGTTSTISQLVAQSNADGVPLYSAANIVMPDGVKNLVLTGSADLTATGNAANNVITANSGNDTLIAGSGLATLIGGAGNDTFVVNNTADVVNAQSGGTNTIQSSVSYTASSNVKNLTGTGANDISLNGNDLDNVITANDGNDTLSGGKGNDTLIGGVGHDTFVLTPGMGTSTIVDTSIQGATIRLGGGLELADLDTTRIGNDLLIQVRGTQSSLRATGYFAGSQTWSVEDGYGNTSTPEALLADTAQIQGNWLEGLKRDFATRFKMSQIQYLQNVDGYQLQADGSWFRPRENFAGSYAGAAYKTIDGGVLHTQSFILDPGTGINPYDLLATGNGAGSSAAIPQTVSWQLRYAVSVLPTNPVDYSVSFGPEQQVNVGASVVTLTTSSAISSNEYRWAEIGWFDGMDSYSSYTTPTSISYSTVNGKIVVTASQQDVTQVLEHLTGVFNGILDTAQSNGVTPLPSSLQVKIGHSVANIWVSEFDLTAGDHIVHADQGSMVIGNVGNNTIYNAGFAYGGTGQARIFNGDTQVAGTGDQWLQDGRTMIVGDGNDTVIAAAYSTVTVDPNNIGVDLIVSDVTIDPTSIGAGLTVGNASYSDVALINGIYRAHGINDGLMEYQYGGKYYIAASEFGSARVFDTADQFLNDPSLNRGLTLADALSQGWVKHIGLLPFLVEAPGIGMAPSANYSNTNTPVVSINADDFAALQPYFDGGFLQAPKVKFGAGIGLADLHASWGQVISPLDGTLHVTLDIGWGSNQGIRVMIPHMEESVGSTVRTFEFADGSHCGLADLVALAPPAPDFDVELFQFQAGIGSQTISLANYHGTHITGGLSASDITVSRDGLDILIAANTGGDSLRIQNWYADASMVPNTIVKFDNGTYWNTDKLSSQGTVFDGSVGNQTLNGIAGFSSTMIAGQNDTLNGGSANDVYVYNAGSGVVTISAQAGGTLQFGAGITPDMISLGIGSLLLRIGNQGDAIHIQNFDPTHAQTSGTIQHFVFADGTVLSYDDLLSKGFDIYGTTGHETLTGTNLDNRIHAGTGDDLLISRGAHDTLYGGVGQDTLVAGNGSDTLVGGAGADTFVLNTSGGSHNVIIDSAKVIGDIIQFDANTNIGNVQFFEQGADLVVKYGTQGASTTIQNFAPNGVANNLVISQFQFADGSHGSYTTDGQGNAGLHTVDQDGHVVGDFWRHSNGQYGNDIFNVDGSSSGTIQNVDGTYSTYTDDQVSHIQLNFAVDGRKVSDSWSKSDGSYGNDTFHLDGSIDGITHNANGSYSTSANDGNGTIVTNNYDSAGKFLESITTLFDSNGNKLSDTWKRADGAIGSDTYANGTKIFDKWIMADGSSGDDVFNAQGTRDSGATYSADGSHSLFVTNSPGNTVTTNYDPYGALTSKSWHNSDGSYGTETFNADGSINNGTVYYSDGSHVDFAYTSQGTYNTFYNANGVKTYDTWYLSDGSGGDDFFNTDGSSSGDRYFTDGGYSYYTNDGQGNYQSTVYGRRNAKLSDIWQHADGTHGTDTFNSDGSSNGTNYNANGSYSTYTNDGQGNVITLNYDAGGHLITNNNHNYIAGLNDTLVGSGGNDTFIVNAGMGSVHISDTGSNNTLQLGVGIAPSQVTLGLDSLTLRLDGQGDVVHIEGFDPTNALGSGSIQNFSFADGTTLTYDQLLARGFDIYGSTGNETLTGTNLDNRIHAGTGDDLLIGSGANDTLYGGIGHDTLIGGSGNEVLIAGTGDTTLIAGLGIATMIGGSGNNTYVINNASDVINAQAGALNTIQTSVSLTASANVQNLTGTGTADLTLTGNNLNNVITANSGNDTLVGGTGNATLIGGSGLDTFVFGYGTGADTVIDTSNQGAVVQLNPGVALTDLSGTQQGNDLLLQINGTNSSMLLKNYFTGTQNWTIQDAANNLTTPQAVVSATALLAQNYVAQLEANFLAKTKASIVQNLLNSGYHVNTDGTYQLDVQPGFSWTISGTESLYNTTTTYTTNLNGNVSVSQTTNSDSFFSLHPINTFPNVRLTSVNFVTTLGTATNISADAATQQNSLTYSPAWLKTQWDTAHATTQTTSILTSQPATPIYGPDNTTVIGYSQVNTTSTTTQINYTGTEFVDASGLLLSPGNLRTQGNLPEAVGTNYALIKTTEEFQQINLSDGNHTVSAGTRTLVNGGVGNNLIFNAGFAHGGVGNDTLVGGDTLVAGTGNDLLIRGNTMVAGDGNDSIFGGSGNATIVINPQHTGVDLVGGAGINPTYVVSAFYQSLGITYSSEQYSEGGQYAYRHTLGRVTMTQYTDQQGAIDLAQTNWGLTLSQAISQGLITYIQPSLPVIATVDNWAVPSPYYAAHNVPVIHFSANDFAALAPYYQQGIIPSHKVVFGQGISANNLHLSWGQVTASITGESNDPKTLYTTLNIAVSSSQTVQVMIPHSGDQFGAGISEFDFADGSKLSMAQLIAMAPPAPSFDPQLGFVFQVGMGQQIWNGNLTAFQFAAGIAPTDVTVTRNGMDLLLTYSNGMDGLRIPNWYANPASIPTLTATFNDGTVWNAATLTNRGLVVTDPVGNRTLTGLQGFANTLVAGVNDTLVGGSGNDTFVVNTGMGAVHISDTGTNNTLQFGPGIDPSQITLGLGSLMLRLDGQGDVVHIEGFDPANAGGSGAIQNFRFADGTVLTYAQLLAKGFDIYGSSGNETLTGTNLDNRIHAGTGDDVLIGSGANDTLYGGVGHDTLIGGSGNEVLIAGTGDTTLIAGTGIATMIGGSGNDTFVINNASDVINAQAGALNTIQTSVSLTASANVQNLTGTGTADLTLTGNNLNNVITANSGNDTLIAGSGIATLNGGTGNDTFVINNAADVVNAQAGGINTIITSVSYVAPANVQNLIGTGTADITLTGNNLNNIITANNGNDTLIAGSGIATLNGGTGNDTFVINNAADVVNAQVGGTNTIQTSVSYTASANVQNLIGIGIADLTLTGNNLVNAITSQNGNDTLIAGSGIATLTGGSGNDTYVINNVSDVVIESAGAGTDTIQTSVSYVAAANVENLTGTGTADLTLTGNNLANVITANSGNDTLIAGTGLATLIGGTGNDTFVINNTADVVNAQVGGINTVMTSVSFVAPSNVKNITGTGTAAITLTGNNLANVITANNGNDTLIAGSGIATLNGGTGNDTFVINNTGDVINAQAGGINTVMTSVSFVAPSNVKNITGTGPAAITLTGNNLANVITANSGNDTLIAGSGIATLTGGTGNNTFVINNTNDVVIEGAGAGADTIQTSVSYVAAANVENLTGTGTVDVTLTGNNLANVITANSGNDTLIAGSGIATLNGGIGNDTFVINNTADVVNAQAGGTNTIQTSVSYTASANVQNLTATGTANLTLTGNALNNVLTANSGKDTLIGGVGNDTLVSGSGIDSLVGGAGNDTYVVNNAADVIVENSNEGTDTILSSVSYVLPANVENLTLTGSANLTATGNTLNNVLTGNAGNDSLIGGSGNDTLIAGTGIDTMNGGAGNDTYIINNTADVITEASSQGTDTVLASVNYVLPANVENLTLTGSGNLTATGNTLANVITANSGNDTLIAGAGLATLVGGVGNDTFIINNAGDVINAQAGGTNTVQTSVSYVLPANVQNITGTGSAALTLTGNNLTNVITANSGNDTLIAGSGLATLIGGAGSDTFVINNIGDVIIKTATTGVNTVKTSVSYVLPANVQNITGTGSGNLTLTGNSLSNVITANTGNDTLIAGSGIATLIGGVGNDTFVVNNTADVVTAQSTAVLNTIQTSVSFTASTNVTDLIGTGSANLTLTGNTGNDLIIANSGTDTLVGGAGTNVLQGGAGSSTLKELAGKGALLGGSGNESITGGTGVTYIDGGAGNDAISLGSAISVVGFNAGGGNDTITAGSGVANVLSLGGGINYNNLTFSKVGNNLVLGTGGTDSITLQNWYGSTPKHDFVTLQIIEQASSTYNASSTNTLINQKIEEYSFTQLVTAFNNALAANPTLTSWNMMNSMLSAHLSGSNTAALGGDLAYYDGLNGNLRGLNLATAVTTLQSTSFGKTTQTVDAWSGISSSNNQLH